MRNFHLFSALLLLIFSGVSCIKDKGCTPKTPASEASQMQSFATANGMNVTAHSTGMFYEIIDPGAGSSPTLNSVIYITYVAKFLDGTIFDQRATATDGFPMNQLIEAWKVGIPLIKKGGQIKLIVPSSMAYGCLGKGIVPPNTIVYFEIKLVDFV